MQGCNLWHNKNFLPLFSPIACLTWCAHHIKHLPPHKSSLALYPPAAASSLRYIFLLLPSYRAKQRGRWQAEWDMRELETNPHVVLVTAVSWTEYPGWAHTQLVLLAKHILCSLNSFFTHFRGQIIQQPIYCSWRNEWTTDSQEMRMLILSIA